LHCYVLIHLHHASFPIHTFMCIYMFVFMHMYTYVCMHVYSCIYVKSDITSMSIHMYWYAYGYVFIDICHIRCHIRHYLVSNIHVFVNTYKYVMYIHLYTCILVYRYHVRHSFITHIMLDIPIDIMLDIPSLRIYTCVDLSQYAHTHTCMYRYIYIDKQVYSYMHVTSHTAPSLMHVYV